MRIAIVTFDGFNELDSFVVSAILNRIKKPGWKAEITSPTETVTSMNGVKVSAQQPLSFANGADAVLFGSGVSTRGIANEESIMDQFELSSDRQLIGSQCSGAVFLKKLGLLENSPVCTDTKTRPFLENMGADVLDEPFNANGNIATAGGCLSSQYLALWVMCRGVGIEEAKDVIHYVAPVGQKDEYLARALGVVEPHLK
jgi:transcriptional regulator GlxA family with amidase domain